MESGHQITNDLLTKLGHRVLSIFFAAYEFEKLYRESDSMTRDPDPLDHLRAFEDTDISETLITLASLARADDDQYRTLNYGDTAFPAGVGALEINGVTSPLKVREACNKIIHAKTINFELSYSKTHPVWQNWYEKQGLLIEGNYRTPEIICTGKAQGGKEWKARIDLVSYVYSVSIPSINAWLLP